VRCSLLALSSYIDAELDVEPAGELEAHLLACDRCQTAMGHLREESERIGALARVHIPDSAVHELFSQIGLIEEGDELPVGPPLHERPVSVEAPPWFGVERGKALPWAPRGRHDPIAAGEPRELIGERSQKAAPADPPELFLWDEPTDPIIPSRPPSHSTVDLIPDDDPEPAFMSEPTPISEAVTPPPDSPATPPNEWVAAQAAEPPVADVPKFEPVAGGPQPPTLMPAQPPQPYAGGASSPLRRMRDAVAVRFALWRGAGSRSDSGVEIVSGAGAPTWNQRAHPKAWSDSPPLVFEPDSPAMTQPAPPPLVRAEAETQAAVPPAPAPVPAREPAAASAPDLADLLGEVAMLAAPLGRTPAPTPTPASAITLPAEPATEDVGKPPVMDGTAHERLATDPAPVEVDEVIDADPGPVEVHEVVEDPLVYAAAMDEVPAEANLAPLEVPKPGRHVRRLHSRKPERAWNPAQPITGRHVLPIGGPAVAAADRDRRLWLFAAVTLVVMVLGLVIGRQATQTGRPAAATTTLPRATAPAAIPPTSVPLPVTTPPVATGPPAPAPQQLTGITNLGTGSSGFTVADVRYGEHPNDFRLVFDLAFPNSVTGAPTTVVGYFGSTTLYVEFTGVDGTAPIGAMPPGQVVASVVPLPMVRNTGRLIFKITLRHNAPFSAYYLSGARLVIDVT
jgi:hypothetical protein